MDRNGYNPSLLQSDNACFLCGRTSGKLDRHEIFGASNRAKSKRLGLWVLLCRDCHLSAHGSRETASILKRAGQKAAMERFGWDTGQFIREFGKNYL